MQIGQTMQNRAIEIHDSTLDRISVRDGDVVLHFAAVYIHQSAGTPGVDAGSCWVQKALLRMGGAVVSGSFSQLPRELLDGQIQDWHDRFAEHDSALTTKAMPSFVWNHGTTKPFR